MERVAPLLLISTRMMPWDQIDSLFLNMDDTLLDSRQAARIADGFDVLEDLRELML